MYTIDLSIPPDPGASPHGNLYYNYRQIGRIVYEYGLRKGKIGMVEGK
jgi:hypothetical protein